MPKENTHLHFAGDMLKRFNQKTGFALELNPCLLGSIIPDVFYYKGSSTQVSHALHGKQGHDSGQLIREMVKQARARHDERLLSFALGHLTHYSLDSCLHPLINQWVERQCALNSSESHYYHVLLETALDFRLNGEGAYPLNSDILEKSEVVLKEVAGMLSLEYREIISAYRNNIRANKLFKIPGIGQLASCLPKTVMYGGLFYSHRVKELEFNASAFEEKLVIASDFALEKMVCMGQYYRGECNMETLQRTVPNIDLEEGLLYNPQKSE